MIFLQVETFTEPQKGEAHLSAWPRKSMPLPKFSALVKTALKKGQIFSILNLVIEESANHILANGDMRSKTEYSAFCEKLSEWYPCLGFPGRYEWVCFSACNFSCGPG